MHIIVHVRPCLIALLKDSNNVSGQGKSSIPIYDELDAILGTRTASSPPVVLDSGGRNDDYGGSENTNKSAQSSHSNGKEDGEAEEIALGHANTGNESIKFNLYI